MCEVLPSKASLRLERVLALILSPFSCAPLPLDAENSSRRVGSIITACLVCPLITHAREIQYCG